MSWFDIFSLILVAFFIGIDILLFGFFLGFECKVIIDMLFD